MQEIELLPSSEQDNRYIHQQLRRYNRQFMRDFKDYSFHIKQDGQIVAGIVAASTMDTLEVEFLFVEESAAGRGWDGCCWSRPKILPAKTAASGCCSTPTASRHPDFTAEWATSCWSSRTPALASTASTTSPKTCERKKKRSLSASLF